ncbi:MAG: 6,7-dimethyl-8-ribityllumazine synthase [Ferruginibacter sp.]
MSDQSAQLYNTTGIQINKDACLVIVKTEWNENSVGKLEAGCINVLDAHQVKHHTIIVPGAFEIPFAIQQYWLEHHSTLHQPSAFIAIGCVIKGDTPHFDYVCKAVTDGVVQLNLQLPVPVIFGVLTVFNQDQIDQRTGGVHGHKGEEAAITALKMMALSQQFPHK